MKKFKSSVLIKFSFILLSVILLFSIFFLSHIFKMDNKLVEELYKQRLENINKNYALYEKKLIKDRFKIVEDFILKHRKELSHSIFIIEKELVKEILQDLLNFPSVKKAVIFDTLSNKEFMSAIKSANGNIIFNCKQDKYNFKHLNQYKYTLFCDILDKNIGYLIFYYDISPIIKHSNKLKAASIADLKKSNEFAHNFIKNNFKKRLLFFAFLFIFMFVIIYILFEKTIYLPLKKLELNLKNFFNFLSKKQDNFEPININSNDEFGRMSKFINNGINVSIKIHKDLENLTKELNKFATVIEQAPQTIIITDINGNIEYANNSYKKQKGDNINQALNIAEEFDDKDVFNEVWEKLINGSTWYGILKTKCSNDNLCYERVYAFPVKDSEDKIINFVIIKNDITEEKKLEEQLMQVQKMDVIGKLAGGIAHDFNNILTVINGFAELTLIQSKDSKISNNIKSILDAGKRAQKLTKNLLSISRKQISNPKLVNVNKLLNDLETMFNRLITNEIEIVIKLKENLPEIKIDESQLEQILLNLLVNSRDALRNKTGKKQIVIKTDVFQINSDEEEKFYNAKKGKYLVISISDNGSGIDKNLKDKIFEPFFTTKEKGRGTGLGLSIVNNIVKQNNGFIYLYSELNKGTTFDIFFPIKETENKMEKTSEMENKILKGNETILLVEDEDEIVSFLKEALTSLNYKIITTRNGFEALEILKNSNIKIDLIITDIIMPQMDGKALFKKVKSLYEEIKIIFISGYTYEIMEEIDFNNVRIIYKPFTIANISNIIRNILDN